MTACYLKSISRHAAISNGRRSDKFSGANDPNIALRYLKVVVVTVGTRRTSALLLLSSNVLKII